MLSPGGEFSPESSELLPGPVRLDLCSNDAPIQKFCRFGHRVFIQWVKVSTVLSAATIGPKPTAADPWPLPFPLPAPPIHPIQDGQPSLGNHRGGDPPVLLF